MDDGNGAQSWLVLVLAAFSAVVAPLLGIIYFRQRGDIAGIRFEVKKLWIEATAFKEFHAFDREREKNWERWRGKLEGEIEAIEKRIDAIKQESIDWKHDKYGPRMSRIELDLARIKDKLKIEEGR